MAQTNATDLRINSQEFGNKQDVAESFIKKIDRSVKETTGTSLFHILTIGSIGASIALYASGKKSLGIFIGLWPPTFQALKAAAENRKEPGSR
jgi:hypothetical protein